MLLNIKFKDFKVKNQDVNKTRCPSSVRKVPERPRDRRDQESERARKGPTGHPYKAGSISIEMCSVPVRVLLWLQ